MTGLLFIGLVVLWLFIVVLAAGFVIQKLPIKKLLRALAATILFLVLIPLPLIDEIVGGMQFGQLCKQHSEIRVDRSGLTGRAVYLLPPIEKELQGYWIPIRMAQWIFVDVTTRKPVVSYDVLSAKGGRLVPSFDSGDEPLTFQGICAPGGGKRVDNGKLLNELGLTRVERPK